MVSASTQGVLAAAHASAARARREPHRGETSSPVVDALTTPSRPTMYRVPFAAMTDVASRVPGSKPVARTGRDWDATRLNVVVFIAGMGSLVVEICASRLLAPFFGSSTIVWANIIGLILLYLSVGYWLGGKLADRRPERRWLGGIILIAAVLVAALPFVAKPVLDLALKATDQVHAGAGVASFFATLALFAVPVTLLGFVSPYAIRLAVTDVAHAGTVAGRLYAISTTGSILGTFASAVIAIPAIGTQRTMLLTAAALAVAAALLLGTRAVVPILALVALVAIPPGLVKDQPGVIYEQESAYQFIEVQQATDGSHELKFNEGGAVHSIWYANSVLTGGEWDMFLVTPKLVDHPVKNVLIIGNAGGTTARAFGTFYPDAHIDAVEIDPDVTSVAATYFGLGDNPNVTVYAADGRPFLALSHDHYDLIFVDAYRQPYIPFYLTTQEFFQLTRDHLTPGGVLALNVAALGSQELPRAVETTLSTVMPAWRWKPLAGNELLVGMPGRTTAAAPQISGLAAPIASLQPLFNSEIEAADTTGEILTDDRAPVELLMDRGIVQTVDGGTANTAPNSQLPTKPTVAGGG